MEAEKQHSIIVMNQTQLMRWIKSGKIFVYVNEEIIKKPKIK